MNNHLSDETIIDYIHDELEPKQKNYIQQHIEECHSCKKNYEFWNQTLNTDIVIPDTHKESIWKKIHSTLMKRNKRSASWVYKGLTAAVIGVLFFVIGYSLGHQNPHQQAKNPSSISHNNKFVIDRGTEIYDLIKTTTGNNHGYAWYNPWNKEMIVFIHDSKQRPNQAYYLEIHTKNATINSDPVTPHNGNVQLYIKNQQLEQFYRLILKQISEEQVPHESFDFRPIPVSNRSWPQ
ncbi:MAG: zf-HC2 domain-containing protein [Bacillaceae bacterium]|nr:zf-HC2 domain-containing protein [Bacillaceae bacterium]